jgi:Fe2+ or Zn2+ uptake regulation protein
MSIVEEIYKHVDKELHKPAAASVYAHLLALQKEGRVTSENAEDFKSCWELT